MPLFLALLGTTYNQEARRIRLNGIKCEEKNTLYILISLLGPINSHSIRVVGQ